MVYPYTEGRDAAYAKNLGQFTGVVGGYFGGPASFHNWPNGDWDLFPRQPKLPIWGAGSNGEAEGQAAVRALQVLGVPRGRPIVVDMETRGGTSTDAYLLAFAAQLQNLAPDDFGWPVFVYGSASTIFTATGLSGYWVADWTGNPHIYVHNGTSKGIRGTQFAGNLAPGYDLSLWKDDAVAAMWT